MNIVFKKKSEEIFKIWNVHLIENMYVYLLKMEVIKMMYEEFIRDFAIRTKKNLDFIKKNKKDSQEVFEVTQMVNSLLGLLVFPKEEYFRHISNEFPDEEIKRILSKSVSTYPEDLNGTKSFKNIIKHIRNAIAHERLSVYPYGPIEIEGFVFEDKDTKNSAEFKIDIPVKDLEIFLSRMCKFIIDFKR